MPAGGSLKKNPRTHVKGAASRHPNLPEGAMVLAAGFGTRMRPITETLPKPLIRVGGRTLLDHSLDRLEEEGLRTVVVNVHHLGHLIESHVKRRKSPDIVFSREPEILDTGGGIANALPLLGDKPFIVINADILWLNGPRSALRRLAETWDESRMDGLLLLHSTVEAYGYTGMGDFLVDPAGVLSPRPERELSPFLFTGIQILHPRLFDDAPKGRFPLNVLYNRAMERRRLYGMIHDGEWFHVGTPEGLADAEAYMHERYPGVKRR
ncbi:MAG: nucleotidyltransferase family protein [Rhodospirillales bacterium]|jgi:MurNAc alpha-1-phosphate uridylyltransferase|nr:nucleotidyltransferase family protein [Rhodospirillales bacterium]